MTASWCACATIGRPDFLPLRRRLAGSTRNRQPVVLLVFDVLHIDGWSTRTLPYRDRRALLDELALDGLAWRTPASIVVEQPEEFVAGVAGLGLEGVVAKRLDSTYRPGRRSSSWVKHKLRREEPLAVTGVRRSREGRAEAVFVARRKPDGRSGVPARSNCTGREVLEQLEQRLAALAGDHDRAIVLLASLASCPSAWCDRLVSTGGVRPRVSARPARRARARRSAARRRALRVQTSPKRHLNQPAVTDPPPRDRCV